MKYLDGQEGDEYLDSGLGDPSNFIGDVPNIEDATTWSSQIDGNPEVASFKIARDLRMQRIPVEADTMWVGSSAPPPELVPPRLLLQRVLLQQEACRNAPSREDAATATATYHAATTSGSDCAGMGCCWASRCNPDTAATAACCCCCLTASHSHSHMTTMSGTGQQQQLVVASPAGPKPLLLPKRQQGQQQQAKQPEVQRPAAAGADGSSTEAGDVIASTLGGHRPADSAAAVPYTSGRGRTTAAAAATCRVLGLVMAQQQRLR